MSKWGKRQGHQTFKKSFEHCYLFLGSLKYRISSPYAGKKCKDESDDDVKDEPGETVCKEDDEADDEEHDPDAPGSSINQEDADIRDMKYKLEKLDWF